MSSRLPRFLQPPVFADERKTFAAQTLNLILLVVMSALSVLAVTNFFIYGPADIRPYIALGVLSVLVGAFFLLKRGQVRLPSVMILVVGFLVSSYLLSLGGIRISGLKFYLVILIISGVLLGLRAMGVVLVATVLGALTFYYAETQGLIVHLPERYPISGYLTDFLVIVSLIFAVLGLYTWQLNHTLSRARKGEGQLAERNQELQRLQTGLEQNIAARTRKLEIGALLSERLNAILEAEQLLTELANGVQSQFGYYQAQVYTLDESGQTLTLAAASGQVGQQMMAEGYQISTHTGGSPVALAGRSNQLVLIDDVSQHPDWQPTPWLLRTEAELTVPINLEGQVIGVLAVQSDRPQGLDEGDANVLRLLANQTAVALRNARLFAEADRTLAEARAAQTRYVDRAWQSAATGRPEYNHHRADAGPLDEETLAQLKQAAAEQESPAVVSGLEGRQEQAAVVAPIKLQDQVIGAMHFLEADPARAHAWTDQEIAFVRAIADQVAQSAENLRLFDETRQRATREQTIREITEKLRAAPNIEQLVVVASEELGRRLGATHTELELGVDPEVDLA